MSKVIALQLTGTSLAATGLTGSNVPHFDRLLDIPIYTITSIALTVDVTIADALTVIGSPVAVIGLWFAYKAYARNRKAIKG